MGEPMGLVISLAKGAIFNIGYRRFVVESILPVRTCIIRELGGERFEITPDEAVSIGTATLREGIRNGSGMTRLDIRCERTVPIWRGVYDGNADAALLAPVVWILVAAYPAVMLASTGNLANAFIGQLLLAVGIGIYNGAAFPAAAEFFPTSYRATGHAIAYQLAVAIFGGTTPLIATWLVSSTGSPLAPGLYVTAIAFIGLVLVQFVPETKGIRLRTASASDEEAAVLAPGAASAKT